MVIRSCIAAKYDTSVDEGIFVSDEETVKRLSCLWHPVGI